MTSCLPQLKCTKDEHEHVTFHLLKWDNLQNRWLPNTFLLLGMQRQLSCACASCVRLSLCESADACVCLPSGKKVNNMNTFYCGGASGCFSSGMVNTFQLSRPRPVPRLHVMQIKLCPRQSEQTARCGATKATGSESQINRKLFFFFQKSCFSCCLAEFKIVMLSIKKTKQKQKNQSEFTFNFVFGWIFKFAAK